jgi:hypothetical protein
MEGQMKSAVRAAVRDCGRRLDILRDHHAKLHRHGRGRMVRSHEACKTVMRGENLARAVKVERTRQRM